MEVAGAGFINFFLAARCAGRAWCGASIELGDAFGRNGSGGNRKVLVEFVSSNPTGPAACGPRPARRLSAPASSNLLDANGYAVHREYYINDAGRQVDILAVSVWLRYLEACGEKFRFPANGYKGDYVREIAAELLQKVGPACCCGPKARSSATCRADEPEGGDKEAYIDAVIDRAQRADRRGGFPRGARASR